MTKLNSQTQFEENKDKPDKKLTPKRGYKPGIGKANREMQGSFLRNKYTTDNVEKLQVFL